MNKRLTAILVVILCMSLSVMFGMTVTATESDSSEPTSSVSSEQGGSTSSTESTGNESTDSEVTSSETESGSDVTSSGDGTSSDVTSSGDETSSDTSSGSGSTSSETTSSKVNKPIYSGGDADGNKFVEQDFSSGTSSTASSKPSTTSSSVTVSDEPIGDEYVDDPEGDEDHFQGEATYVASDIYKIIWIPAVISVLCIAALITVNIMFKKKYPKTSRGGSSNSEGPHRRKR